MTDRFAFQGDRLGLQEAQWPPTWELLLTQQVLTLGSKNTTPAQLSTCPGRNQENGEAASITHPSSLDSPGVLCLICLGFLCPVDSLLSLQYLSETTSVIKEETRKVVET